MGVYIDMEMPQKTYAHCMLIKSIDGSVQLHVCTKNSEELSEWESYNLVSVPPHGRLIDADAFLGTIRPICDADANAACAFETVKRLMIAHINAAPTIIPAEEGET